MPLLCIATVWRLHSCDATVRATLAVIWRRYQSVTGSISRTENWTVRWRDTGGWSGWSAGWHDLEASRAGGRRRREEAVSPVAQPRAGTSSQWAPPRHICSCTAVGLPAGDPARATARAPASYRGATEGHRGARRGRSGPPEGGQGAIASRAAFDPTMHCVAGPGRLARLALCARRCEPMAQPHLIPVQLDVHQWAQWSAGAGAAGAALELSLPSCIAHCTVLAVSPSCTVSELACPHRSEQEGHRGRDTAGEKGSIRRVLPCQQLPASRQARLLLVCCHLMYHHAGHDTCDNCIHRLNIQVPHIHSYNNRQRSTKQPFERLSFFRATAAGACCLPNQSPSCPPNLI